MRALNDAEREQFDALCDLLADRFQDARAALVNTEMDGHDVAVVVAVTEDGGYVDGEYAMTPMAVLVDDRIMSRLREP